MPLRTNKPVISVNKQGIFYNNKDILDMLQAQHVFEGCLQGIKTWCTLTDTQTRDKVMEFKTSLNFTVKQCIYDVQSQNISRGVKQQLSRYMRSRKKFIKNRYISGGGLRSSRQPESRLNPAESTRRYRVKLVIN